MKMVFLSAEPLFEQRKSAHTPSRDHGHRESLSTLQAGTTGMQSVCLHFEQRSHLIKQVVKASTGPGARSH